MIRTTPVPGRPTSTRQRSTPSPNGRHLRHPQPSRRLDAVRHDDPGAEGAEHSQTVHQEGGTRVGSGRQRPGRSPFPTHLPRHLRRRGRRHHRRRRARAALLVAPPGSYASHHTAVLLWGGWSPSTSEIHLSSPIRSTRSERRGVVAHVADPALTPRRRQGVTVSPPARAFLELASTRPNLVDLVVAGDSLVTAAALSPEDLVAAADEWTGRWCRLARRAARLVRTGVNSPMESRVRMLIVLAGLPEPTTNHILRYPNGDWRRRLDLSYVGDRIVIEYDGRHHLEHGSTPLGPPPAGGARTRGLAVHRAGERGRVRRASGNGRARTDCARRPGPAPQEAAFVA